MMRGRGWIDERQRRLSLKCPERLTQLDADQRPPELRDSRRQRHQFLVMDRMVVNGANGNSQPSREGSVVFDGLFGTSSITNSTVSGGIEDNIRVENTTATPLTLLTVSGTGGTNSFVPDPRQQLGEWEHRLPPRRSVNANMAVTVTNWPVPRQPHRCHQHRRANTATVTSTVTNNYVIGGSPNQGNLDQRDVRRHGDARLHGQQRLRRD
ncbi:MAG: hypothetical protein R3F44_19340 [Candidatus Competibacteraceae bacterium]